MVVVFNFPYCFPLQNVFLQMTNIFLQMANVFLQMANVFVHRLQGERRLQCGNPSSATSSVIHPCYYPDRPHCKYIIYHKYMTHARWHWTYIYSKISSTHYPDWHDWDNVLIHWRPSIASLWQLSFFGGVLQSRTISDLKKINWDEEQGLENKQKS